MGAGSALLGMYVVWFAFAVLAFEAEKKPRRNAGEREGPRTHGRTYLTLPGGKTTTHGGVPPLLWAVAADLQDLYLYEAERGNATVRQGGGRLDEEGDGPTACSSEAFPRTHIHTDGVAYMGVQMRGDPPCSSVRVSVQCRWSSVKVAGWEGGSAR